MKYKIWNKTDDIYTPSGDVFTAEQMKQKNGWANVSDAIICDNVINGWVFMEYTATKAIYKDMIAKAKEENPEEYEGLEITDELTKEQVLEAIEYFETFQPTPKPTAEEEIAAQLEFQNIFNA